MNLPRALPGSTDRLRRLLCLEIEPTPNSLGRAVVSPATVSPDHSPHPNDHPHGHAQVKSLLKPWPNGMRQSPLSPLSSWLAGLPKRPRPDATQGRENFVSLLVSLWMQVPDYQCRFPSSNPVAPTIFRVATLRDGKRQTASRASSSRDTVTVVDLLMESGGFCRGGFWWGDVGEIAGPYRIGLPVRFGVPVVGEFAFHEEGDTFLQLAHKRLGRLVRGFDRDWNGLFILPALPGGIVKREDRGERRHAVFSLDRARIIRRAASICRVLEISPSSLASQTWMTKPYLKGAASPCRTRPALREREDLNAGEDEGQ